MSTRDVPPLPTRAAAGHYLRDLTERVGWTFAQAFGGTLVLSGWFSVPGVTDLSIPAKAGLAGVAAVLALAKGLVAKAVGQSDSASTAPGV